tara:strand:- start:2402 stop:2737 length:336 start_codon:yes stop_codon:yes gene_type:complete
MRRLIEITQREADNKWIRWELMDSQKGKQDIVVLKQDIPPSADGYYYPSLTELIKSKQSIGQTATWSRYKWVATGIWDTIPNEELHELISADENYKLGRRKNDNPVYTFSL